MKDHLEVTAPELSPDSSCEPETKQRQVSDGGTGTVRYQIEPRPWIDVTRTAWLLVFADVCLITICWSVAHYMRLGEWNPDGLLSRRFMLLLGSVLLMGYMLESTALNVRASTWVVPMRNVAAHGLAGALIAVVFYLLGLGWTKGGVDLLGRGVLIPALVSAGLLGAALRFLLARHLRERWLHHRWLLIGQDDDPGCTACRTALCQRLPDETLYFVDPVTGRRVRCRGASTEEIQPRRLDQLLEQVWAGVVLMPNATIDEATMEILMHARLGGLEVLSLAEFYEETWGKIPVSHLHHRWFVETGGFGLLHEPMHRKMKRLVDVSVSLVTLVACLPMMLVTALTVRVAGGRGPIIYRQVRIGKNGLDFVIYKFRTMRQDAEASGAQWAQKQDPRVFWVGRWMRKFRIDELPQLWNILCGDMSFIGPRPERREFTADLERQIPFFSLRLLVKPGLTGWAQVNYPYGASVDDAREKLEYDLYYIKHQDVWLDLGILLRTLRVVLRGFGGR